MHPPAAEPGGNRVDGFKHSHTDNGSSQGENMAFTGVFVPSSLGSGLTLVSHVFQSNGFKKSTPP